MKLLKNLTFITGRWPPSFLLIKNKLLRNSPGSDSPVELHFSSTFPLFLNLSVTFPLGSLLLTGKDHTEMGFERKEFWNPAQWVKYSHLELIFPNFLNKTLVFRSVQLASLWPGKDFLPKDVLLTCLHPEVVECWGKVILLLLPCCLCVCSIDLTKNACGARPPPPIPYDAGGPTRKSGLFLLNVVGSNLSLYAELLGISALF